MIYAFHNKLLSYKMKNDIDVVSDRHEGKGNSYRVLVENFVGKRLIGIFSLDEYNIKMNLKEIGCDDIESSASSG